MKTNKLNQRGFTLIELLVVMIILAALVLIAASTFQSAQIKSRDSKRKSDLRQISNALEVYYADHNRYPASDSAYRIVGCGTGGTSPCNYGEKFARTNSAGTEVTYMVQLPMGPQRDDYLYISNGSSYQLYARLENHKDAAVKNPTDADPNSDNGKDIYGDLLCDGELGCNFGLSSTNVPLDPVLSN